MDKLSYGCLRGGGEFKTMMSWEVKYLWDVQREIEN